MDDDKLERMSKLMEARIAEMRDGQRRAKDMLANEVRYAASTLTHLASTLEGNPKYDATGFMRSVSRGLLATVDVAEAVWSGRCDSMTAELCQERAAASEPT